MTAVVYDSGRALPPTFASRAGFGDEIALVSDLTEAHRLLRLAAALVIVGGDDQAGALGLLASCGESSAHAVVLFLADAEHQRRVMLQGARRGAAVLIGQPSDLLAACLRELMSWYSSGDEATISRADGPDMKATEICLRLLAARRARQRRGRSRPTSASQDHPPKGSVLVPSAAVVSCARGDGTLLLDMAGGMRMMLDRFGARVWSALAERPTLAALLTRLYTDDTSVQRLAEDVTQLLVRWRARGVISWR